MLKCPTHPKYQGKSKPHYKGHDPCWCNEIYEAIHKGVGLDIFTNPEGTHSYIIEYKFDDHDGLWHWINCAGKTQCTDPKGQNPLLCSAAEKSYAAV